MHDEYDFPWLRLKCTQTPPCPRCVKEYLISARFLENRSKPVAQAVARRCTSGHPTHPPNYDLPRYNSDTCRCLALHMEEWQDGKRVRLVRVALSSRHATVDASNARGKRVGRHDNGAFGPDGREMLIHDQLVLPFFLFSSLLDEDYLSIFISQRSQQDHSWVDTHKARNVFPRARLCARGV